MFQQTAEGYAMQPFCEESSTVHRGVLSCVGTPVLGTSPGQKSRVELQNRSRTAGGDSERDGSETPFLAEEDGGDKRTGRASTADADEREEDNHNISRDAEHEGEEDVCMMSVVGHEKEKGAEEEDSSKKCCTVRCCLVKCCSRSKKTGTYGKGSICCANCCCNRRYSCIWIVLLLVWIICVLCWVFFGPLEVAERLKLASLDDKSFAASDSTRMSDQLLYQAEDFHGYDFGGVSSGSKEIPRVVHKVFMTRGRKESQGSGDSFLKPEDAKNQNGGHAEMRRRKALINPYFSEKSAMIMPLDMIDVVETWNQLATGTAGPIEVRMYDLEGCRKYISERLPVNSVLYRNVVQSFGRSAGVEYRDNEQNRILDAFDLLSAFAFKADLFRLLVLLAEGGVYSDVGDELSDAEAMNEALWPARNTTYPSTVPRRTNPDFLAFCDQRLTKDSERARKSKAKVQSGNFQNTFIASVENFFVLRRAVRLVLWNVAKRKSNLDQLAITGPKVLGRALGFTEEQYYTTDREEQYLTVFKKTDGNAVVSVPRSNDNWNPIGSSILLGSVEFRQELHLRDEQLTYPPGAQNPLEGSRSMLVQKEHPDWSKLRGNSYSKLWWAGATFCSSEPTKQGCWCSILAMFFTF